MMDFVEGLAPIQQVGIVSCRTGLMPMYEKRGDNVAKKDPIIEHIPLKTLSRTNLEYIIMVKNKYEIPIPLDLTFKSSSSYKSHST